MKKIFLLIFLIIVASLFYVYNYNPFTTRCCPEGRMYLNGEPVPRLYAYSRPDIGKVARKAGIPDDISYINSNNAGTKIYIYTLQGVYILNLDGTINIIPMQKIMEQFKESMKPFKGHFTDELEHPNSKELLDPRKIYLNDDGEIVGIVRFVGSYSELEQKLFLKDGKIFDNPADIFPLSKDGRYVFVGEVNMAGDTIYNAKKTYKLVLALNKEEVLQYDSIWQIYTRNEKLYLTGGHNIFVYSEINDEMKNERVIKLPSDLRVVDIDQGSSKAVLNHLEEDMKPEWFLFDMGTGELNSLGPDRSELAFFLQDDILENVRKRLN